MNIVDVVIFLLVLLGAALGFKRGVIRSVVSLVGTILVFVLSFVLKNPLSVFLYTYLPFFDIGITVINILVYEVIAFLIVFVVLLSALKFVVKITGIIETILKFTIVLGIPSKILGAIFGFIEMYVFSFIVVYILATFNVQSDLINNSNIAKKMLEKTPFMSSVIDDTYMAIREVTDLSKNNNSPKEKREQEGLEILLKYNILSPENANILIEKNKINIKDAKSIIEKYEKSGE